MEKTDVIFRTLKNGDVDAIFPSIPGNRDLNTCTVYSHIGQHSYGDLAYMIKKSRPSTESEYKDLYKELTNIGYNLNIVKRSTSKHRNQRAIR